MTSLCKKYDFELSPDEFDAYVDKELGKVVEKLEKDAKPCPGVMAQLDELQAKNHFLLAVVSSSALSRVKASIKKVGMEKYFKDNHVYSAATSLPKPTSKPDPAIYLHACKDLGVTTSECLAVEDSRSGATAAKNAKIPLIGYVGPYTEKEEQDEMYNMLKDECGAIYVMRHWDEFPKAVEAVQEAVSKLKVC